MTDKTYSQEDVEKVANIVLESWYRDSDSGYICHFCMAYHRDKLPDGEQQHKQDCITLIAQDLLT